MKYRWEVRAERTGDRWGASWHTTERAAGGPVVSGHVGPVYERESDARGHAAMWIARYEDAMAAPTTPDETTDAWTPTDLDLAEALDAHRSQFGHSDVRLGA